MAHESNALDADEELAKTEMSGHPPRMPQVAVQRRRPGRSGAMQMLRQRAMVAMMSLEYASDHLTAAVKSLAISERSLQDRLQVAWDDHVQMLWMKPCLTTDLLLDFRDFWRRYTASSDDPTSTTLRALTREELKSAIDQLVTLSARTTAVAAQSPSDVPLAALADLA
jgi:hypothetical protein